MENERCQTPLQALSIAFRKVKPTRREFDVFKAHLHDFFEAWDETIREKAAEIRLVSLLERTFGTEKWQFDTEDDIDLVIRARDKTPQPPGVLLELKRPGNRSEMPKPDDLDRLAMQELLLYFLEERRHKNNRSITRLIITDLEEWYLFDAQDIDRLFAQDQELCAAYDAGPRHKTASDPSRKTFYHEAASPAIQRHQSDLSFTYFRLSEYRQALENDEEKTLIPLYKILSPEHLLKLPFVNDSNTLDEGFYFELLHIMGLTEVERQGKKYIVRKPKKQRHQASLLEDTILQLDSLKKLERLRLSEDYGEEYDEQLFQVALELCLTWVNRVLFLKLLEAQLLSYHQDEQVAFLNRRVLPNYGYLNKLFFQVLARKPEERLPEVQAEFGYIPYLNSSLFEPTPMEHDTVFISGLENVKKLPLHPRTVLKDRNGKRQKGAKATLDYLFDFLDAYDFGSQTTEEIQEQNKTLISAPVLGLIFEKINGYRDGSFFTPGFITMLMCRESLRPAIVERFREELGFSCQHFTDLQEDLRDWIRQYPEGRGAARTEANRVFNTLRVCDPAVGSGHFLVSALNELLVAKAELGILQDAQQQVLNAYDFAVENDEFQILTEGEPFRYRPHSPESLRVQQTIFHEKQQLIENCLFGVDINPNSVKICQLRLWIELLKNAYYRPDGQLETLPNIDINIKTGDSLISRFALDDARNDFGNRKRALIKALIPKYREAVLAYKNVSDSAQKAALAESITDYQEQLSRLYSPRDKAYQQFMEAEQELKNMEYRKGWQVLSTDEDVQRLRLQVKELRQRYEAKTQILRRGVEWRFAFPEVLDAEGRFAGFDVVMGNPPYIYNRDLPVKKRNFFKQKYQGADDLYVYFTYLTTELCRVGGYVSLITPNTYFSLVTRTSFRQFLLDKKSLKFVYSGFCFPKAYVETMVMFFQNRPEEDQVRFVPDPEDYESYTTYMAAKTSLRENTFQRFFIPTELNKRLNAKVNTALRHLTQQFQEVLAGKHTKTSDEALDEYRKQLKSGDYTYLGLITEGEQGLVTGNNSRYLAVIAENEAERDQLDQRFLDTLYELEIVPAPILLADFQQNRQRYYDLAEAFKEREGASAFGRFFNYRTVLPKHVTSFEELTAEEQQAGTKQTSWVYYQRGNAKGFQWYVPPRECIRWDKKSVQELKQGVVTNSRWQGARYFSTLGFAWVDYFTDRLKAFLVNIGPYSKNTVKLHTQYPLCSDYYLLGLLNSRFMSYFIKAFITSTHTLQINDGRLIPVKVPTSTERDQVESIVAEILTRKQTAPEADTTALIAELDRLVYRLYRLSDEEVAWLEAAE